MYEDLFINYVSPKKEQTTKSYYVNMHGQYQSIYFI